MFEEIPLEKYDSVRELFEPHKRARNLIFNWIDLQMGKIIVDSLLNPTVALLTYPPMGFVAGDSTSDKAIPLVQSIPPLTIIVAPDEGWSNIIKKEWGEKLKTQQRTRMSHEHLRIDHMRQLKGNLDNNFTLQKIDLATMENSDKQFWEPIPYFFGSFNNFIGQGFGYSIKTDNKTVSVAYTAFPFINEFEIQVVTLSDPEYRRKGFATVACAAVIEEGLSRGMVPHWDAANPASVKLAEKLGYTDPDPFDVYYWVKDPSHSI
ncbi:MAG: GNAT family N-acetyltransferase [Candidatus Thorarchaeota archaeon]|jgi:RimJ/RimL family protein N-acetyltransferase